MPVILLPVGHLYHVTYSGLLMDSTGAFGSGAAFALEDGWILARAIEYTRSSPEPIAKALAIFDAIRSPYYLRMFVQIKPCIQIPSS